jgi:hypothetical protein
MKVHKAISRGSNGLDNKQGDKEKIGQDSKQSHSLSVSQDNKLVRSPIVSRANKLEISPAVSRGSKLEVSREISQDNKLEISPEISRDNKLAHSPVMRQAVSRGNKLDRSPEISRVNKLEISPAVSQDSKLDRSPAIRQVVSRDSKPDRNLVVSPDNRPVHRPVRIRNPVLRLPVHSPDRAQAPALLVKDLSLALRKARALSPEDRTAVRLRRELATNKAAVRRRQVRRREDKAAVHSQEGKAAEGRTRKVVKAVRDNKPAPAVKVLKAETPRLREQEPQAREEMADLAAPLLVAQALPSRIKPRHRLPEAVRRVQAVTLQVTPELRLLKSIQTFSARAVTVFR